MSMKAPRASRTAVISYFKVQPLSRLETAGAALRCHFAGHHNCRIRRKKDRVHLSRHFESFWVNSQDLFFKTNYFSSSHNRVEQSFQTQTNLHHFTRRARETLDQAPESHNQTCSDHGNLAAKCPALTPHSSYTSENRHLPMEPQTAGGRLSWRFHH